MTEWIGINEKSLAGMSYGVETEQARKSS